MTFSENILSHVFKYFFDLFFERENIYVFFGLLKSNETTFFFFLLFK